jgi:hypothetical protein
MPIPERAEPETPQADARLLEFIVQRRQHQAQQRRRQLVIFGATAVIGLIVLTLTAAGLLLFNRSPATSLSATGADPPSVRSRPAPQARARAADLTPPRTSSPSARAVEPDRSQPPAAGPPESGLTSSGPAGEPLSDSDPARRTASWLVQTYGRLEAENRALTVAEFYSGERRAFWQRVLTDVRQTPER